MYKIMRGFFVLNYITQSLELHLFFARIMKEHCFFLKAGFVGKDVQLIEQAGYFNKEFDNLLLRVVNVSNGIVDADVLNSGEVVTEYTLTAERITERLSGINIDRELTERENNLSSMGFVRVTPRLRREVRMINRSALVLLNGLISFKEKVLKRVRSCRLYTFNYPLLLEHIMREAKLYRSYIVELENRGTINLENRRDTEMFWNRIMMEHALFIRGLLDPMEESLIETANDFANQYRDLLEESSISNDQIIDENTGNVVVLTKEYIGFKTAGTKGIIECEIQSIILPLLADHVLREANHYFRIIS